MSINEDDDYMLTYVNNLYRFMQPQGHVQVLYNMTIFGLDVQEALDAPRICLFADPKEVKNAKKHGTPFGPVSNPSTIIGIEEEVPAEVIKGLEKLGHKVKVFKSEEKELFGRE